MRPIAFLSRSLAFSEEEPPFFRRRAMLSPDNEPDMIEKQKRTRNGCSSWLLKQPFLHLPTASPWVGIFRHSFLPTTPLPSGNFFPSPFCTYFSSFLLHLHFSTPQAKSQNGSTRLLTKLKKSFAENNLQKVTICLHFHQAIDIFAIEIKFYLSLTHCLYTSNKQKERERILTNRYFYFTLINPNK